jgi:hypothetical protein
MFRIAFRLEKKINLDPEVLHGTAQMLHLRGYV